MHQKANILFGNAPQAAFLNSQAQRKTFNGGRGVGKTLTIGLHNRLKVNFLPNEVVKNSR